VGTYALALRRTFRAEGLTAQEEQRLSTELSSAADADYHDVILRRAQEFVLARARRAFYNAQLAATFAGLMIFTLMAVNEILAVTKGSGRVAPAEIGVTGAIPSIISASFLAESRLAQADLMSHVSAERARRRESKLIHDAFDALAAIGDDDATAATASELALHFANAATTPAAPHRTLLSRLARSPRSGATTTTTTATTAATAKNPTGRGRTRATRTTPDAAEQVVVLPDSAPEQPPTT
jgi:ABC-type Na+ efflux pump permease subunit